MEPPLPVLRQRLPRIVLLTLALFLLLPALDGIAQPLQPQPTSGPDDPPVIATLPPRPTPVPTRPARPTEVSTTPSRPTPDPTQVPAPTQPILDPQPLPSVPSDTAPTPVPPLANPEQVATLRITALMCDRPGFDPYPGTGTPTPASHFAANCLHAAAPTTFKVIDSNEVSHVAQTTGGVVTFVLSTEGEADTRILTYSPSGIGHVHETCTSTSHPDPWRPPDSPAKGVRLIWPSAGDVVECAWYLFSGERLGSLTIRTWLCPAGFDPLTDGIAQIAQCGTMADGINLSLHDQHWYTLVITTASGASDPGMVSFTYLLAGTYLVTQDLAGYASIFTIGCTGVTGLAVGPGQTIVLTSGEHRACDWFLVPAT